MRITESRSAGQRRTDDSSRWRQRGQGLVIFAGAIVFFMGFLAIVIDVTWYWMNTLKVQRAADAAALAGAVMLPDNPTAAVTRARDEATKNGYTNGTGGVTVTAAQNPSRDIQLNTSVTAPVSTFFMHLFGINTITASREAAAEYVLPVPMGSPLNYFGAYGSIRGSTIRSDTGQTLDDPGDLYPTTIPASATGWSGQTNAYALDGLYATATSTTSAQQWGTFRIPTQFTGTSQTFTSKGGITVSITGHASAATGCYVRVDVTPDNGTNWYGGTSPGPYSVGQSGTAPYQATQLLTTGTDQTIVLGAHNATSATDTDDWFGATNWTSAKFGDGVFRIRITPTSSTCTYYIDSVGVRVWYDAVNPPIAGPHGESLNAQGVWTGVLSQGSDIVSGDAYLAQKNGSSTSTQYSPSGYYDYAIELPVGASAGKVWIFDPGFCATGNFSRGMGDHIYSGTASTSTFYDIYDTNNTLYDTSDDTWIAGNTGPAGAANPKYGMFRQMKQYDPSQWVTAEDGNMPSASGWTSCERGAITDPNSGGYWHNRWWPIASSLAGTSTSTAQIYRLRVRSTDPYATSDQASTQTLNNFSFFASATGTTPRVYGLGTMVAFSPLPQGQSVDLYMSQISATYAGKTMKVSLWDPGDTSGLTATLQFLKPTTTGYTPASFTWTATKVATGGTNCNGSSSGTVNSVLTYSGSSRFNGCWLVMNIPVDTSYTAPTPPGEPGPGWWKIRYTMGSGSSDASDLTTWKTQMVGNPVHLVTP